MAGHEHRVQDDPQRQGRAAVGAEVHAAALIARARTAGPCWVRVQGGRNIGWEHDFVAVDDHSCMAFAQVCPDESKCSAEACLRSAVAWFDRLGVAIQRVLTDNGKCFHSGLFAATCLELGISQKFTRTYRPQASGKAERFIQSALREWACGHAYASSDQRPTR